MKNNTIIFGILHCALCVATTSANAQTVMSLDECLAAAHTGNLTLRSGKIAIERAKDLQATAFDLDKTSVSLAQTPTTGGGPENALTLSQSFEFPTVYGARRSKLKAETRMEETRYEVEHNQLDREVSAAYYTLLYAMERQRKLVAQDTAYHKFLSVAEARLKSGVASRLEQMNARRLFEENHLALRNAARQVEAARLRLALWLNSDEAISPRETSLPIIDGGASAMLDFNPANTPAVQLSSQECLVAENSLKLARQAFLPDISLAASTQMLIKSFNPYDIDRSRFAEGNFMGFEVGLSVPIFFGAKRAMVKAARKDVELSKLRLEQQTRQSRADYETALGEYRQAKAALDYYLDNGNADAAETARLAQVAYEKGDIDYVEYMQNLQSAFERQNAYIESVNDYNQATIKLKYILNL